MEKRAILALALSFAVFLIFMVVGEKSRPPEPPAPMAQAPAKPEAPPAAVAPVAPAAVKPAAPMPSPARSAKEVVVETDLYRAVFTEQGAALKSFQLKKYRQSLPFTSVSKLNLSFFSFDLERYQDPGKVGTPPKELVRVNQGHQLPLSLSWQGKSQSVPAGVFYEADQAKLELKGTESATLTFTGVSPEGLTITKTYKFWDNRYQIDLDVKVANRGDQTLEGQVDLSLAADYAGAPADTAGFVASVNRRLEQVKSGGLKEPKTFTGKVDWAGLEDGYFLIAASPQGANQTSLSLAEPQKNPMLLTLRTPENLAAGKEALLKYVLYFGPKDLDDLKALNLGLDRAVDFGWFDFLAKPFLYVLKFLDRYTGNYGWAIIILTILTRLLLFYPNHKSYKSMKEMQKLQPKVAKLREKYKDDKETMNKELMALYRTFKVNPMSGCLPMVLQLPVFIALYNVLGYAIELRHASFIPTLPFTDYVWLADLSSKDPLLITPIVMGATMFIQQKMTPSPGDPAQAKMMMFLPIIFTFLFLNFASGLVLYWLVNNVLSIGQQYYTNKNLV